MRAFIGLWLVFIGARVLGTLPHGKWYLVTRRVNGKKRPMKSWHFVSPIDEPDDKGDAAHHWLTHQGLWDATQQRYIDPISGYKQEQVA
jgi:hypothetical protein